MAQTYRHQCVIYEGTPSKHLGGLAALIKKMLDAKRRCLYLNSPAMVEGIRTYLKAVGVGVGAEIERGALILASGQDHVVHGRFDPDRMLEQLEEAVEGALRAGFDGLWATGDMTWEFGGERNFSKLLEYEYKLEKLFERQPALGGLCQYHTATLPRESVRDGLLSHETVYVNETIARINPHYMGAAAPAECAAVSQAEMQRMLARVRSAAAS